MRRGEEAGTLSSETEAVALEVEVEVEVGTSLDGPRVSETGEHRHSRKKSEVLSYIFVTFDETRVARRGDLSSFPLSLTTRASERASEYQQNRPCNDIHLCCST